MAIALGDNIGITGPLPTDNRYFSTLTNKPWTGCTDVTDNLAGGVGGVRYTGLTVNIEGTEYWFKNGIENGDLIEKTTGGGSGTLNMSGSTVGGLTTYVDATTICARPDVQYDGTNLILTGNSISGLYICGDGGKFIQIGDGATGNYYAIFDMVGDATYTDYGMRLIRNNSGADANSTIFHRGTGDLGLHACEAGRVVLSTNNTEAVVVDSAQIMCIKGNTAANPQNALFLDNNKWYGLHHQSGYGTINWFSEASGGTWVNTHASVKASMICASSGEISFLTAPTNDGDEAPSGMVEALKVCSTGVVSANCIKLVSGAASGCVLQSGADGTASWATPSGGGVSWNGSTVGGIATYVDSSTVCSQPNAVIAGGTNIRTTGGTTQTHSLSLGDGRTGDGFAYIDLVGDTTYTDYGLRILRSDGGENTVSIICHEVQGIYE